MIFREKIVEFLGGSTKPKEIVKQEIPQVVPPQPVKVEPKTLEVIPFEPLPDKPTAPPPMLVREVKKEVIPVEKATNQETQSREGGKNTGAYIWFNLHQVRKDSFSISFGVLGGC